MTVGSQMAELEREGAFYPLPHIKWMAKIPHINQGYTWFSFVVIIGIPTIVQVHREQINFKSWLKCLSLLA